MNIRHSDGGLFANGCQVVAKCEVGARQQRLMDDVSATDKDYNNGAFIRLALLDFVPMINTSYRGAERWLSIMSTPSIISPALRRGV